MSANFFSLALYCRRRTRGRRKKIGEPRCFKGNHFHLHRKISQRRAAANECADVHRVYSEKRQFIGRRIFRGGNRDRFVAMLKRFLVEYLSEMLLVWSQNCLRMPQKFVLGIGKLCSAGFSAKYLLLRRMTSAKVVSQKLFPFRYVVFHRGI